MRERVPLFGCGTAPNANTFVSFTLFDFGGSDGCGALAPQTGVPVVPQPLGPVFPQLLLSVPAFAQLLLSVPAFAQPPLSVPVLPQLLLPESALPQVPSAPVFSLPLLLLAPVFPQPLLLLAALAPDAPPAF